MSLYFWLDIIIVLVPLALVFDRRIQYYKKIPAVMISVFIIGGFFVVWDVLATLSGYWAFNDQYVMGFSFGGLPVEEILFFVAIPFSCLFIYETVCYFHPAQTLNFPAGIMPGIGILMLLVAGISYQKGYSLVVLTVSAFTIFFVRKTKMPDLFRSSRYWTFLALSYIPFLLFNYFLTSLPVVVYNPQAVWGARVGSIPLEDFFYNFSLQTLVLWVYLKVCEWQGRKAGTE